jgi:hypothetical protein
MGRVGNGDVLTVCRFCVLLEGDMLNAYCADHKTMEGAVLLGSLRAIIAEEYPDIRSLWQSLMENAMEKCIKKATVFTL